MAIDQTEKFFQSFGIETKLQSYGILIKDVDRIITSLERHKMVGLGEKGDVTIDVSKRILMAAFPG